MDELIFCGIYGEPPCAGGQILVAFASPTFYDVKQLSRDGQAKVVSAECERHFCHTSQLLPTDPGAVVYLGYPGRGLLT